MDNQQQSEKFDSWAIVELFGHQRIAGRVTEATIGGCALLRVDVPDQPATEGDRWSSGQSAIPAYTRYFGNGAIYSMTPCTEEVAVRAAAGMRAAPPMPFSINSLNRPALTNGDDDSGDDSGGDEFPA